VEALVLMTQHAYNTDPLDRFMIFHPFKQHPIAALRDDLLGFLLPCDVPSKQVIGFHFLTSMGFSLLPQHYLLPEISSTPAAYQDFFQEFLALCHEHELLANEPKWFVLDMGWLNNQSDKILQQEQLLSLIHQADVFKQHNFIFHFNLEAVSPNLIQQSLLLYPYLYWDQKLSSNTQIPACNQELQDPLQAWLSCISTLSHQNNIASKEKEFFHAAFDCFPHSILEADYSEIMKPLMLLKQDHPDDWRNILQEDLHFSLTLLKKLKINHANQTAVKWVLAENEDNFFQHLPDQPSSLVVESFHHHLLQIADESYPAQFIIDLESLSAQDAQITLDVIPMETAKPYRMLMIAQQNTGQMEKGLLETTLFKISQLVHTVRDLEALYAAIHTILNGLVDTRNMYIALYDEESQTLEYPYHVDECDEFPGRMNLRNGKTEYVLRTGETLWVSKEKDLENIAAGKYDQFGTSASDWLGVPLITQGKSIGVLTIQTYDGSLFSDKDKSIMEFCSSQIALAIERKIAENRLLQNQQELSQILMGSSIPTRVIDKHKRTTLFNKAYEKLSGLLAEDIVDKDQNPWIFINNPELPSITELIASDCSEQLLKSLYFDTIKKHPLIEGAYLCENMRIQTHLGVCWVNITAAPLLDLQGNVIGAIENVLDMTNRMKAEDDIRVFKTVADYANTGMVIANPEKQIVYINSYLATRLGYEPDQLILKPLSILFGLYYQQIDNLMERISGDINEIRDTEINMQSSSEASIPFIINAVKIKTSLNQQSLISFSCFNISAQKKREEALNRYANRLEILHKIDEAILEASSTEEIARSALHIFLQLVKFSFAGILEICNEDQINLYQAHHHQGRYTEENHRQQMCPPALMEKLCTEKLFISRNVEEISQAFGHHELLPFCKSIQSCMAIPLIVKHDVIGQFLVGFSEENALSPEIVEIIKEVSRMISIGIYQTRLYEKIEAMATIDELTGIYNRRQLIDLGERAVAQAQRYYQPLSVIVFDVDHFKQVNDTYGHPCGDQVLKAVVKRCQTIVRSMDILGRYGGDEFVIILPETSMGQANQVASRLRAEIFEIPFRLNEIPITLSISVGISTLTQETDTLTSLINQADEAMYQAKNSGRNQVVFIN